MSIVYAPHQQRVVDERVELDTKRTALKGFIDASPMFKSLPDDERGRLIHQYQVMTQYSSILTERIAAF